MKMTPPPRDELFNVYHKHHLKLDIIALMFSASIPTVRKWLKDYNIIPRPRGLNKRGVSLKPRATPAKPFKLNDRILKNCLAEGMTVETIAAAYNTSVHDVNLWIADLL